MISDTRNIPYFNYYSPLNIIIPIPTHCTRGFGMFYLTTLILRWALMIPDPQLRKETLSASPLSRLLLPVAYVRLKSERLKDRIKRFIG